MKNPLILYFICLCLFVACGDDEKLLCKDTELIEAPQEFLSYWYFPKGSYWIYKLKDTTGVYDTMRVVSDYKRYCNRGQSNDPDCDQAPCTWMYSNTWEHSNYTFFGGNRQFPPQNYNTTYSIDSFWLVKSRVGTSGAGYLPPYPIIYPYKIGESYLGNNIYISEDTLECSLGFLYNTLCLKPDYGSGVDSINANYVKYFYITPNIGPSMWVYNHNRVWELIAYDVIP